MIHGFILMIILIFKENQGQNKYYLLEYTYNQNIQKIHLKSLKIT